MPEFNTAYDSKQTSCVRDCSLTLVIVGATPAANCSRHWVEAQVGVERQATRNKTIVGVRDMRESIVYREITNPSKNRRRHCRHLVSRVPVFHVNVAPASLTTKANIRQR